MLDQTLRLLDQLVDQRMRAAGDVLEVSLGVWAIHGSIPVDGEVILAEFSVLDEVRVLWGRVLRPPGDLGLVERSDRVPVPWLPRRGRRRGLSPDRSGTTHPRPHGSRRNGCVRRLCRGLP
jgi:hypothetical protein